MQELKTYLNEVTNVDEASINAKKRNIKNTQKLKDFLQGSGYREVKYFHPDGKTMPNGHGIQRGGYIKECKDNTEKFELDEGVHGEQYGLSKYRGGVIVFATDDNAVALSDNKILNKIKQFVESLKNRWGKDKIVHRAITRFNNENEEYIGAYSLGNFFKGRYVGDNGEMYSDKSVALEVDGLSSASLLRLAEILATAFQQETVLVKDLNKNKIYLADAEPDDRDINKLLDEINIEVK